MANQRFGELVLVLFNQPHAGGQFLRAFGTLLLVDCRLQFIGHRSALGYGLCVCLSGELFTEGFSGKFRLGAEAVDLADDVLDEREFRRFATSKRLPHLRGSFLLLGLLAGASTLDLLNLLFSCFVL